MSRWIDADALKEHTEIVSYKNEWYETEIDEFVSVENIDSAPTIKTKQVKYYDDDENVWKVGSVIVDEMLGLRIF